MKSSKTEGYEFPFSAGLLKEKAFIEMDIDITDAAQDGWEFHLRDSNDKSDLKLTIDQSKKEIEVTDSKDK